MAGTASAAPVSGSVQDGIDAPVDATSNSRAADAQGLTVTYDDVPGVLEVRLALHVPLHQTAYRHFNAQATLSSAGSNGCNSSRPLMYLNMSAWSASLQFTSPYSGVKYGSLSLDGDRTYVARFSDSSGLVGRPLRCVNSVSVSSGYARDEVAPFCIDGCPTPVDPPPTQAEDKTPPKVHWSTPKTGQTIKGILSESNRNCRVDASDASGIAYTENYVDGKFNDRQTSDPWACELDTRTLRDGPHTLKVRAYDRAGNWSEASVHVTVKNQGAPVVVVPRGPQNPVVQPGPDPGPVQQPIVQPTPVQAPVTPAPVARPPATDPKPTVRTISKSRAGREARKALSRRYRHFRTARLRTVRCRPNASQTLQTCSVRWIKGRAEYAGKVRVRPRGASRYSVFITVRRVR